MKKYFSVGETAKIANVTSETLRHYDRIGLLKPSKKDEWTKYRYYTKEDIIRLQTIKALQVMDLPLEEIRNILNYDDFEKIIEALTQAEKNADEKIASIEYSKSKIQSAKAAYQNKIQEKQNFNNPFIKKFPTRIIMLSDNLETPTLDNLWNYLSHFYDKIAPSLKDEFVFEDLAGIYTENNLSRLFAVCIRYTDIAGLKILPSGKYLCANCTEDNRENTLNDLLQIYNKKYNSKPKFTIEQIVVNGILQWTYQVQLYLEG